MTSNLTIYVLNIGWHTSARSGGSNMEQLLHLPLPPALKFDNDENMLLSDLYGHPGPEGSTQFPKFVLDCKFGPRCRTGYQREISFYTSFFHTGVSRRAVADLGGLGGASSPSAPRPPFCIALWPYFKLEIAKFSFSKNLQSCSLLQEAHKKYAIFPVVGIFSKNLKFWANFVKICSVFGVLCVHNFVLFCKKVLPKFTPMRAMTNLWIRPWPRHLRWPSACSSYVHTKVGLAGETNRTRSDTSHSFRTKYPSALASHTHKSEVSKNIFVCSLKWSPNEFLSSDI